MRSPREYRWIRGTKIEPCSPSTLGGKENEEMVKIKKEQVVRKGKN